MIERGFSGLLERPLQGALAEHEHVAMLPAPTSVFDFERPIVAAAEEFGQGAAPAAEAALVQLPLQRGAERGQVELHAAVDDPAPALEHGRERHEHVEDPPQAPHLVAGRHHARIYIIVASHRSSSVSILFWQSVPPTDSILSCFADPYRCSAFRS